MQDRENILNQGRTSPRCQITMAHRKFMMVPCIFNSKYSWFMCVFAVLKFPAEYDCVTHMLTSGSETDVQHLSAIM